MKLNKHSLIITLLLAPSTVLAQWQVGVGQTSMSIPFVAIASSDHTTEKTDVSSVTCDRIKNGTRAACGGSASEVNDANQPGGWKYTLDSADVDTAGSLVLRFSATGMDPVRVAIQVGLDNNIVNSRGTLQSATSTTAVLQSTENTADNRLAGSKITITEGTDANDWACIASNVNSTDTVTIVGTFKTTPDSTSKYDITSDAGCAAQVSAITTAVGQKIADITLRRTTANVEASSDGDTLSRKSLYGAAARLTHRLKNESGSLKTYKADGTTVLDSQTITTDSAAQPIIELQ